MKRIIRKWILAGGLAALAGSTATAGDSMISFGIKGVGGIKLGGGDVSATFPVIEYQAGLSELVSLSVGVGHLNYDYSEVDGSWTYDENGKGPGLSLDVKFYPGRKMFDGFYVGPGVGAFSAKVDWTEVDRPYFEHKDSSSGTGFEVHLKTGFSIVSGSVTFDPNLQIGYFLSMPKGDSTRSNSLGIYALLGLNIGVRF